MHADADFPGSGWGVCGCRGRIVCTPNSPVLFPSSTPASDATQQQQQQQQLPYPPAGTLAAITLSHCRAVVCSTPVVGCCFSPPPPSPQLLPCRSLRSPAACAAEPRVAMNILNQPISPGGHPVFPVAAKESGHLVPASSVRFDGAPAQPSTTAVAGRSHAHCPRWQAQTLRRASSYVGIEHVDGTTASVPVPVPVPAAAPAPFKPLTLDFLRSVLDRNCSMAPAVPDGEASAPPPPQMVALRVVVTSAVALDARQAERIARKMRRLTGFVDLKVETAVDASLIAGFVVCYGTDDSHVIDLSVRGQLAALKNRVDSIDQTAHAHGHPHH